MVVANLVGPDVVICGAARAGTSFLASLLGSHPQIDPGAIKEPNFFSREYSRGFEWYDGLFRPRQSDLLRLDASTSYTYAHSHEALGKLARQAPDALVVYSVREPLGRLLSHYHLNRNYFRNERAPSLGEAINGNDVYSGASDYARWLTALDELFPKGRVIVVPFNAVTERTQEVVDTACRALDISSAPVEVQDGKSQQHRNEVVEFRHEIFRRIRRSVRRSGAYPLIRRTVGINRLRSLRIALTRTAETETLSAALGSCDLPQLSRMDALYRSAQSAAEVALKEQDTRLGLEWAGLWSASCPPTGLPTLLDELEARRDA